MSSDHKIDLEKLSRDMASHISEGRSERSFSLAVTGDANPDFYRHWRTGRQSKRLTADVFMNICRELGQNPAAYFSGLGMAALPNATVLTSTFAALLDSLGIPPYEDARAQKLASSFPDALKRAAVLHAQGLFDEAELAARGAPDDGVDRPEA